MDLDTLRGLVDSELHEELNGVLEMCNAPFAVSNGIELVSADRKSVKMKKTIVPRDLNSNGVVHGATSFGLIDHTFAVLSNLKAPAVGLSCNIVYHRPCTGPLIEAEAKIVNESRSLMTIEVQLSSNSKLVASAVCVGFKSKKEEK
ncbi:MAG: PaaI family thioesterase [Candidatus Methanoplasma sp.]|jgi:acyl-CoA thioesterase|nr:PaaI family thioesterase [Candidatus Methanoplasma sp.]